MLIRSWAVVAGACLLLVGCGAARPAGGLTSPSDAISTAHELPGCCSASGRATAPAIPEPPPVILPVEELLHVSPAAVAAVEQLPPADEELTRAEPPGPEPAPAAATAEPAAGPVVTVAAQPADPTAPDDTAAAAAALADAATTPPAGDPASGGSKPSLEPAPGAVPAAVIQRIVRLNLGKFRSCYQRGLQRNPKLQGRVTVRFVIRQDGLVRLAANAGSELSDPLVVRCIVRGFFELRFPEQPRVLTIRYPLRLTNGSTDPKQQALRADQKARWTVDDGGKPTVEQRLFEAMKEGIRQGPPAAPEQTPVKQVNQQPTPSAHDEHCPRGDPLCAELPQS